MADNVSKWPGSLEAWNARNGRVRSDIEEDSVARERTCTAVIQPDLKRFRRHETPTTHDQFGAARFVVLQMPCNQIFDHGALAPLNRRHIDSDGTSHRAEQRTVPRQMRDPGAANLILAGQAGDIGTGAPDPPPLDDRSPSPRLCHVPSYELATSPTAKDQDIIPSTNEEVSAFLRTRTFEATLMADVRVGCVPWKGGAFQWL
jgi:hypothetical protein